ncbi:hypothetical protein ACS3SW_20240, partial [Roseobacteraceae bacterium S113]
FGIENVYERGDAELRGFMVDKARDFRALQAQISALPEASAEIATIKAEAEAAGEAGDLEKVVALLDKADALETVESAKTKVAVAEAAMLSGRLEKAYAAYSAAADSFGSVDPSAPIALRNNYFFGRFFDYGLLYGGDGLSLAAKMLKDAAGHLTDETSTKLRDAIQSNLALVRTHLVNRLPVDQAQGLLVEVITAFEQSLQASPKDVDAKAWAATNNNLGNALATKAQIADVAQAIKDFSQAVEAYEAALQVYTREELPNDWAMTQTNLGNALTQLGQRMRGAEASNFLSAAVTAFEAALEVRTQANKPAEWAATQNNLSNALSTLGQRMRGAEALRLLRAATAACQAALEVHTRDEMPLDWAMTQNNLGAVFQAQGLRTEGEEARQLFTFAVAAFEAATEVSKPDEKLVDWAMRQENLAITKLHWARQVPEDAEARLAEALDHVDIALEVFDPEHIPYNFEKASRLREDILAALDGLGA